MIVKLANALQISVDYLLGEGYTTSYNKKMIKRPDELETLPEIEKQHISMFLKGLWILSVVKGPVPLLIKKVKGYR